MPGAIGPDAFRPQGDAEGSRCQELMPLGIDSSLTELRGIGPARARSLRSAGFQSVADLLHHIPFRYEDRRQLSSIGEVTKEGVYTLTATVGELRRVRIRRRGLSLIRGWLEDETGRIPVLWFNRPYLLSQVRSGERYLLHGQVRRQGARLEAVNPTCELASRALLGGRVVAVYNSVGGLGPSLLRRLLQIILQEVDLKRVEDLLPRELRTAYGLPTWGEAMFELHQPAADADVSLLNQRRSRAHERLIYGEFLELQLELGLLRSYEIRECKPHSYPRGSSLQRVVQETLPFQLTGAQTRALGEILNDMRSPLPMLRLLQGDVGSGKTIVAALSLIVAMENGLQGAFMAPTELLAEQHFRTLKRLLEPRFHLALVSGSAGRSEELRGALADGSLQLAVGTHALIQEGVVFDSLGLVVVDEQHRFGVTQRQVLQQKGQRPDVLVMTATPIPRSLALTVYGDLSLSVIDELPPGRGRVITKVVPQSHRHRVYRWLGERLAAGGQAYLVFPMIDDNAQVSGTSIAREGFEARDLLSGWRSEILHGRVDADERERIMKSFSDGDTKLLIATSIVEVGLDVPQATVMIIDGAERFGLAQLHQLRGRVGRGAEESHCIAMHGRLTEEARQRLGVFAATTDGFRIAEADLEIRGPGDLLGTRQAGAPLFRVANIVADQEWLSRSRVDAEKLLADHGSDRVDPFMRQLDERARCRFEVFAGA